VSRISRTLFWLSLSLLSALLWVAAFAYLLVWCGTLFAEATGITSLLVGLWVLGVGTRLPAAFEEYYAYQTGQGDLNRLFLNNVLQICLAIPLPFYLFLLVNSGGVNGM